MGECSLCDKTAVVVVNNAAACGDHVDEVMRSAFRGIAILKGLDPDEIEAGTAEQRTSMQAHLLEHMVEGGEPANFTIHEPEEDGDQ